MNAWFSDRLSDLVTALGGPKQKNSNTAYAMPVADPQQELAAYRGDWIARKVVDIPAFDMTRRGRAWQAEKDQITKIEALERRLGLRQKRLRAMTLARLTGGSVMLLGLDPRLGNPDQALNLAQVKADDLKYIHTLSRYEITPEDIIRDPVSPNFGEPSLYSLSSSTGGQVKIHPSRVVRFLGAECPEVAGVVQDGWGDSALMAVSEALMNAGIASTSVAALLQEAKVDVFKIKGLTQKVGTKEYRDNTLARFTLANIAKSSSNALLMDAEEEWEQKIINFAQLPEVVQTYMMLAAAAADIPATRFLSQSPAGMNATGESDLRNYYDRLQGDQEMTLRPRDEKVDEVLIRAALGDRPEEIFFKYVPLWQPTETQISENRKRDAETAKMYVDAGIVPLVALAKAVQNGLIEDGTYPGLEAALAETSAKVGLPVELFKTLLLATQGGGAPKEALFMRLSDAGLLPLGMTFDKFEADIEAETPDLPPPDQLAPGDLGGPRGQGGASPPPAPAPGQ